MPSGCALQYRIREGGGGGSVTSGSCLAAAAAARCFCSSAFAAVAVIVSNRDDGSGKADTENPIGMGGTTLPGEITIPSIMISNSDGLKIIDALKKNIKYQITRDKSPLGIVAKNVHFWSP